MRAGAAKQAMTPLLVPVDDEVFAEQPDRLDRPIAGKLIEERGRLPIPAQQRPRGLARSDAGDALVLLRAEHGCYSELSLYPQTEPVYPDGTMPQNIELGLDTFGDITADADGRPRTHAQVIRDVIEEAVLAGGVGFDAFGVGEHHRPDFAVSAPDMVLAAIAGRTKRIWLGSAVTVLSADDPIRVFERFSTLNAASNGRAEVTLGRGSFTESFPLFGYKLSDYEVLFEEKLELFVALLKGEPVTWSGTTRPPLTNQRIYPPIEDGTGRLRTWIGVGGSPESVV